MASRYPSSEVHRDRERSCLISSMLPLPWALEPQDSSVDTVSV